MKNLNFIIFTSIILGLISCSKEDRKAKELINRSIKAHGGQATWNELQGFAMEKETWLYFEDGETEAHSVQYNSFRNTPYFEAVISWETDGMLHRLSFNGGKTQYVMGENEIQNQGFLQNKKRDIDAAYYVLNKPFDLLEGGKNLVYQGETTLPEGQQVEVIQVIDGNPQDPLQDIWWYYFDAETAVLVGYKVKTSDHFSLVYNRAWDESLGIRFPSKRESYRVDSASNVLYLRAAYEYRNFERK